MNSTERGQKIQSYGNAYDLFVEDLQQYPRDMWKFKPAENKWSIHEIIVHLADSEANSFIRCRRFLAEPGSKVMGYDQDLWALKTNYLDQNPDDALELFRLLRKMSYELIKNLPHEKWANIVEHSENGIMTMDDWLNIYEAHIPVHIKQMQRVYESWKLNQNQP